VEAFASFFRVLYLARMRLEGEDKMWWVPHSKNGFFGVKSFYNVMGCLDGVCFPWKSVWCTKVPLRMTFFGWSAAFEKILTMDNLRKQHIIVVIGVVYVKGMKSLWTIFFFVIRLLMPFGIFSSVILDCLGLRRVVNLYDC
jgi:hypothetical protein